MGGQLLRLVELRGRGVVLRHVVLLRRVVLLGHVVLLLLRLLSRRQLVLGLLLGLLLRLVIACRLLLLLSALLLLVAGALRRLGRRRRSLALLHPRGRAMLALHLSAGPLQRTGQKRVATGQDRQEERREASRVGRAQ